jgi:formate hydrogenlyase subunit 3/multisubunit Na+/H+ antiporter MnhD subunit
VIAPSLYVLVPLLPVLAAPMLLLPAGLRLVPAAPWLPLAALALLPLRGDVVELPWLLLGTRLGIDAISLPLLLLASVTWTLAGWHARRTLPLEGQQRFFFFWLLTWSGNLSVLLCLDAASFYAAYALVTFAAYGLVVHLGRPADYRAGRIYIVMSVLGEGMLLAALLLLVADAGNLPLAAGPILVAGAENAWLVAMLMLAGFGIKVGLAGLHMWLPLAHPQAPVPASAVLSGVILKAGLIGWLRFLPLGQPGFATLGYFLLALGLIAALAGIAIGLTQRDIKTLLAYSSVSQMGLVSMTVALALLDPLQSHVYIALAVLYALHHGLNKAALFLSVDLLGGAKRLMRALLWLPAAALAGLPFTSGALVKANLKDSAPVAAGFSTWLAVTSAATTVLMLRFLVMARRAEPGDRAPPTMPWNCLLVACLSVPWLYAWWELPIPVDRPFSPSHMIDGLASIGIGLIIAVALERLLAKRRIREIPPGDVLHFLPRLRAVPKLPVWRLPSPDWATPLARIERRLAGIAVAVMCGALAAAAVVLL